MSTQIDSIFTGVTNCYVVRQRGTVLVDAGQARHGKFLAGFGKLGVDPKTIQLLLLTHAHWDHTGSSAELRRLSSCRVAVNTLERQAVEKGDILMVPGYGAWGKTFAALMRIAVPLIGKFEGTQVDVELTQEERSAEEFGIEGTILHTPGHSAGSSTLLLASGEAFVGDLAMGGFPRFGGPGMPILGQDRSQIRKSWRLLLDRGAKTIYPGHGPPFDAGVLQRELEARS